MHNSSYSYKPKVQKDIRKYDNGHLQGTQQFPYMFITISVSKREIMLENFEFISTFKSS